MCIVGVGQSVQEPQERVRADWYTGFARQPSATFAAGLECECGQQFGRAVGTASVAGQHAIEALGEDLAWTAGHVTEPPAAVDSQTHGVTAPGQIERAPVVATVLPPTQFATLRARNSLTRRFDNQDQTAVALDDDQDDAPLVRLSAKRHGHRHLPRWPR